MLQRNVFVLCLTFGIALAQIPEKPAFEVATVKPSDPNPTSPLWVGMDADAGRVRYSNITLKDCIRAAYRVRDFQIEGPDWISRDRFEIIAKLPAGAGRDQIPEMMQALLAERFKLELLRGSKDQSVYALTIGKKGASLKPADMGKSRGSATAVGPDGRPRPAIVFAVKPEGVQLIAPAATLPVFVEVMSRFTGRPVVDMTGLSDPYDITLTFAPEVLHNLPQGALPEAPPGAAPEPAKSVFDAVQEVGLKLERKRAPLELLTVVRAEQHPSVD